MGMDAFWGVGGGGGSYRSSGPARSKDLPTPGQPGRGDCSSPGDQE